jgi:geranylgeranyl pyrophosphate synthase
MNKTTEYLQQLINQRLNELILARGPKELIDAASYSINSQAKRFRPILTLIILDLLGKDYKTGLDAACAIELIHTFSLIHDDLPCMDNDDFRRGKPSLHKAFKEPVALLTGDFLTILSFEVLTEMTTINNEQKIKLIKTLAKNSGGNGMAGGQILDMLIHDKINWPELVNIHLKKTASLIVAAVEFGLIIANASPGIQKTLLSFANNLGLLYQLVDDLIDEKEELKPSAVSILGKDKAIQMTKQLYEKILAILKQLPFNTDILIKITRKVIDQFVPIAV